MKVVKRKLKPIKKFGERVTIRPDLSFPLVEGKFENKMYDELIPFAWLLLDHVLAVDSGDLLFPFSDSRGQQIIKKCTNLFPNWFRTQCEMNMGRVLKDHMMLSMFIGIVDPNSIKHYISYAYRAYLKRTETEEPWYRKHVRNI